VPNKQVIDTIHALAGSKVTPINIHLVSGRSEIVLGETTAWLKKYVAFDYSLTMRPLKDHRPDHVLKIDLVKKSDLNASNVLCVFDDRKSVVEMWRREGFCCYQVADHDF
jgi:hypothetical protein